MPLRVKHRGPLTRYSGWLPANPAIHESFIKSHLALARAAMDTVIRPGHNVAVQAFEIAIKNDPNMLKLFNEIFLQVSEENKIEDLDHLLYMCDNIVESSPSFHFAEGVWEPIGVPMVLLFDLLMNTSAGYDLFRMPAFNAAMQNMLNAWAKYLTTKASSSVLHVDEGGWFSSQALERLEANGRGPFKSTWVVPDPEAPDGGYDSWDAFFNRDFIDEARPLTRPIDSSRIDNIVYNPCESTIYRIVNRRDGGVKAHDQFWLKDQAYSLYDMLAGDKDATTALTGGTVYQAFLSPFDYHRWRAPVGGIIKKVESIPGSYYAALPDAGALEGDPDLAPGDPHAAQLRSQAWLTVSSARTIIYIDNPLSGLVCFIAVGMAEISTCEPTVAERDEIEAGDQLGMFHYGGSSFCMIFGPHVDIKWDSTVEVDSFHLVRAGLGEISLVQ